MKKKLLLILFLSTYFYAFSFQSQKYNTFIYKADKFLNLNVTAEGLVAYKAIKSSQREVLANLVNEIATMKLNGLSKNQKKAFYINSYNILVIRQIVKFMPISSPLKHAGFFDIEKNKVAGEELTLNDIENKKIRMVYKDPRIHFALVCGAKGCPKLQSHAYKSSQLETQLNSAAKFNINSAYFIRHETSMNKVLISKIFEWYLDDFGKTTKTVLSFINKYRKVKFSPNIQVGYYDYDWSLNIQK